ncbi:MAG TPA: hypothetical protein VKS21_06480 [Spirochaetota bacterium]|nr:hypothetical protein [Spirochaetota bacterium]
MNISKYKILIYLTSLLLLLNCHTITDKFSKPSVNNFSELQKVKQKYLIINRTALDFKILNGIKEAAVAINKTIPLLIKKLRQDQRRYKKYQKYLQEMILINEQILKHARSNNLNMVQTKVKEWQKYKVLF